MSENLFRQNVIAVIWDFDNTLIPGVMQGPIFDEYGVDATTFWTEANALPRYYASQGINVAADTAYLNHMLTYVREGQFKSLTNAKLRELGARIQFFPGLPGFFTSLKSDIEAHPEFSKHDITLEHYIVSTGLRQMILGSAIASHVDGVWACEFIERAAPSGYLKGSQQLMALELPRSKQKRSKVATGEISEVVFQIDNTTKTRAIFEINKGTNKDERISVNARVNHEDRRVPFPNMIYVADGPSDIPVYSILQQYGGHTLAVYGQEDVLHAKAYDLQADGRVHSIAPADYRPGAPAVRWLHHTARQIATEIVARRERLVATKVHAPPGHTIPAASGLAEQTPARTTADGS